MAKTKEKILEYNKIWRQNNKEKVREYSKKWYHSHKETQKKYRQEHAEAIRKFALNHYYKNKVKYSEYAKAKLELLKRELFIKLGNKCKICGFSDMRVLQIDHINGGGNQERNKMCRINYLKYLLKLSENELFKNYQILCANCNWIKKIENKEV